MALPTARKFLSLLENGRRRDRAEAAIGVLERGLEASSIRKVDLDEAKSALGVALQVAWENTVATPFFYGGQWKDHPEGVYELYSGLNTYSLHDCISSLKKLTRTRLEGPAVDAMRNLMDAALPLAEAARDLKDHVVKGRVAKPNSEPQPSQTGHIKVTGTCGCCQRSIAVGNEGNGTMAHHGYQRPGWGEQTASCPGIKFKPLEKSLDGLNYMITGTDQRIDKVKTSLIKADDRQDVPARKYSRELAKDIMVTVSRGQPEFPKALEAYKYRLEGEILQAESLKEFLAESLVTWTKFHLALDKSKSEEDKPSPT